jgi:hypothetical protein
VSFRDRLQHAWNAFTNRDPTEEYRYTGGYSSSSRPDRPRLSRGNEQSIATSVFNRIAMDVAAININHVMVDQNSRYLSYVSSGLNNCLTLEANKDQTGRAFIQDVVLSMLDEGCVAIVPVDTNIKPNDTSSVDIVTMRTGKIKEWYPDHVLVELYNDQIGMNKDIKLAKSTIGIIENPLYAVINETNSTLQRLIRKLVLLDSVDNQSSSGKLDLIMQLPYVIKTEARRKEAEKRKKDLEDQLSGSKYGIGYIDGTEKVTQLNRPIDNNLMKQVEYLTSMLYSQLGITTSVLDGTADEKTMLNYYNRTVRPILSAITDEMKRKFLSKTARTQGQSVEYFKDPFRMLTLDNLAEIADKLVRNEVTSKNEIRQAIGLSPSDDPKADQLQNPNMPQPTDGSQTTPTNQPVDPSQSSNPGFDVDAERTKIFNEVLDSLESDIDSIIKQASGGDQNG